MIEGLQGSQADLFFAVVEERADRGLGGFGPDAHQRIQRLGADTGLPMSHQSSEVGDPLGAP